MKNICSFSDMKVRICEMEVETCTNVDFDSRTNELKLEIGSPEILVLYNRLHNLNPGIIELDFEGVKMTFIIDRINVSGTCCTMRFNIKPPCISYGEIIAFGRWQIIDERQEVTTEAQA